MPEKLKDKVYMTVTDPLGRFGVGDDFDTWVGDYGWDNGNIYIECKGSKVELRSLPSDWYVKYNNTTNT